MDNSSIIIMVLTNLIMLLGGCYLGVLDERKRALKAIKIMAEMTIDTIESLRPNKKEEKKKEEK